MNEFAILASAIEAGLSPLPPQIAKLIDQGGFDDQRAAAIAATVRANRLAGQPFDFASLGEKHPGLIPFISSELMTSAMPLTSAEFYAGQCMEACQVRRAKSIGAELIQSLNAAPKQAQAVIAAARAALDSVTNESANGLPDLIDAAAFVASPIEPPAELVGNVLHRGSKLAFGGSSKSCKTWTLLDLAISVSTGENWLGFTTTQGKVLFLNFEIQPHAWQRRIADVAEAKGVTIQPGAITLWNLRGHGADFRQLMPRIIQRCRTENFALIVLDPIYKLYGGTDENAAGDVAELLNSLENLAVETGAAIAFGAHFAKGNASAKEAIDRISGSGVFARDPDSLLIFTKHETDDAFTVEPILRNFKPVEPFVVRWEFPLMRRDNDLDPSKLKQTGGRKKAHDSKELLALIANNDGANPISVSEWARLAEMPRKTLTDYLAEMRRKNWIETIGEGIRAKQAITNEGKSFISKKHTGGN